MNFDIAGVWGMALLALPIVVLLLAAIAYARAEAMATARPLPIEHAREAMPPAAPAPLPPSAPLQRPLADAPAVLPTPRPLPPQSKPRLAGEPTAATPQQVVPHPPEPQRQPSPSRPTVLVTAARPLPSIPELPRPAFPKAPPSAAALAKHLADAELAGKEDAIADLKVALGMARFREGASSSDAANDVRQGLIMAMQQNRAVAQAHARLALGDLCKAGGDPTTACEHWQLARDIFAKAGDIEHRKAAETRMRANGCPTDWVLNDF